MNKLSHLQAENFKEDYLLIKKDIQVFLNRILSSIFNDQEFIAQDLRAIKRSSKDVVDMYDSQHLMFHTRDEEWMINFFTQTLDNLKKAYEIASIAKQENPASPIKHVSRAAIRAYINHSMYYRDKRTEYEKNVVKEYIKLFQDDTVDDFQVRAYEKQDYQKSVEYDDIARNKIVKAMRFLGIRQNLYERTIEENGALWKDQTFKRTFENICRVQAGFSKSVESFLAKHMPGKLDEIKQAGIIVYKAWKAYHNYLYNKKNETTLEKMGRPIKKIPFAEVEKLRTDFLEKMSDFEYLVFKAKNKINEIKSESAKHKKVNGNVIDDNIQKREEYWNTHQPETNDILARNVKPSKNLEYWDNHQPDNNLSI